MPLGHPLLYDRSSWQRSIIAICDAASSQSPSPREDLNADALKAKKAAADLEFVEEKKLQVIARRKETGRYERAAQARAHSPRILVISLRQRLLEIAAQHARDMMNVSDERELSDVSTDVRSSDGCLKCFRIDDLLEGDVRAS